jgi:hypothetical protein
VETDYALLVGSIESPPHATTTPAVVVRALPVLAWLRTEEQSMGKIARVQSDGSIVVIRDTGNARGFADDVVVQVPPNELVEVFLTNDFDGSWVVFVDGDWPLFAVGDEKWGVRYEPLNKGYAEGEIAVDVQAFSLPEQTIMYAPKGDAPQRLVLFTPPAADETLTVTFRDRHLY